MMTKREILDWLDTLADDAEIGIDEGGLILTALPSPDGDASYLEVGGISEESRCDKCEAIVRGELVGCPNGEEICRDCFNQGVN